MGNMRKRYYDRSGENPPVSQAEPNSLFDEDFDFDGDENAKSDGKRTFLELEDDDEDTDIFPPKKVQAPSPVGNDHATTTILNLRASLEERDKTIADLQKELGEANVDLGTWRITFQSEPVSTLIGNPEPETVQEAFRKLQASEMQLQDELQGAKRRESAMLSKLGGKEQKIVNLKALVHDLKLMLKAPMLQARRLLLDQAIHGEFTRMKKEVETAERKVKELQEELAAVQFTPHSKNGKMLMAKCRTLQEENEEIGREASEGKMHELGTKLVMQKAYNMELKRGYQELFEYVEDLNVQAERSQQTIYHVQRQIQQKEVQLQQKDSQLAEHCKQSELREASLKMRDEEKGHPPEGKRDTQGEDDSRDKQSGESKKR